MALSLVFEYNILCISSSIDTSKLSFVLSKEDFLIISFADSKSVAISFMSILNQKMIFF